MLGVFVSVTEWGLTGHRHVLQKRVQRSIVLQNMWESQGGHSRPTSHDLPGGGGSELCHLMVLWEDRVTVGRRKSCRWEPRTSKSPLGGADVARPGVD